MKHLLHRWRTLDPDTAPADDASAADVLGAVVSAVDRLGWFCGVTPESSGGYRAVVWSGMPPVWMYPAWCLHEHDALAEAFVVALGADRERYGEPAAVESDKPEDYL